MEHFQFEWMLLEEHLQRSLDVPFEFLPTISSEGDFDTGLQPDFLIENPKINPSYNLNLFPEIPNQIFEADYCQWWSSICAEFDDAWKPMHNSQINPNPNPNPNNCNFFNIDETLNAVVEEGLRKSVKKEESVISENELEELIKSSNDSITINNQIIKSMSKMETLKYEEIRKHFDMPISMAAKELKVGLTVLKKRCRELNIKRWPHRKIKSLISLISNVKEMGLAEVAEVLDEQMRKLKALPEMEFTTEIKRLRQACFKANYKKRKALGNVLASHY